MIARMLGCAWSVSPKPWSGMQKLRLPGGREDRRWGALCMGSLQTQQHVESVEVSRLDDQGYRHNDASYCCKIYDVRVEAQLAPQREDYKDDGTREIIREKKI